MAESSRTARTPSRRWWIAGPNDDPFAGGAIGTVVRGIARTAAAFAIAATAFVAVIVVGQPVTNRIGHLVLGPGIYAEYAGAGFVIALFWVWAGAQAAPRGVWRDRLAVVLFAAGAVAAWRLLGPHRFGSHCNGVTEIAASYVGGGLGLILAGVERRGAWRIRRTLRTAGLLLPLLAVATVTGKAWGAPRVGALTWAHLGPDRRLDVYRAYLAPSTTTVAGEEIVWTQGRSAEELTRAAASGRIWIERDLGSGGSQARIVPVSNAVVQSRVEASLQVHMRSLIADEIARGYSPRVCAQAPPPRINLSRARFFRVIEVP